MKGIFDTHTNDRTLLQQQWKDKNKKCIDELKEKLINLKEQVTIYNI